MNAFCGAVDYKSSTVDFELLKRMSIYLGGGRDRLLCAGVLPGCAVVCSGEAGADAFQPVIRECGGRKYMSAALSDGEAAQMTEGAYLAESLIEGYIGGGMSSLERLYEGVCAVIFDGAFGETVLISDRGSHQSIYYTLQGSAMYFSSELRAILSVIETFEGRIKVDKDALRRHVMLPNEFLGERLFSGVRCVRSGEGIIFSGFGISEFRTEGMDKGEDGRVFSGAVPIRTDEGRDVCAEAEAMLDLFGYPQFDIYMPSLIERLERARSAGSGRGRVMLEGIPARSGLTQRYLHERARVIGRAYGISVRSNICVGREKASGDTLYVLRAKRRLEGMLSRELENERCVLYELFDPKVLRSFCLLKQEKNIPARVRLAGMLYQTVRWFEKYNISF